MYRCIVVEKVFFPSLKFMITTCKSSRILYDTGLEEKDLITGGDTITSG